MYVTENPEKSSTYYDTIYASGYNTSGYYPLYKLVLDGIKTIEKPRVLEIGCGIGDLGKMIVEQGIFYRGFDFSEEAIRCSRRICPQGDFRVGDAYDKDSYFPEDYNVTVALEVLEHLDDLRVISNIPSGVNLFASVPDYNDIAHLRIYQDPQRDIIERFRPYLDVLNIVPMASVNKVTGRKMTIYVFHAVRKTPAAFQPGGRLKLISDEPAAVEKSSEKAGRNDPCPCGSGRKYKKCCLA